MKDNSTKPPWGFWATVGLGALIGLAFVAAQVMVAIGFVAVETARSSATEVTDVAQGLATNGFLLAVATLVSAPLCIGLVVLFVVARRGPRVTAYLALNRLVRRALLQWLGITLLFAVLSDGLSYLLDRPIVPDFMITAYETAGPVALLWLALVVAAPLFEEVFFRGFLFEGFRQSIGPMGAVVLTSLAWTVLHLQYGLYELATIFVLGIVFGIARLRSGSLYAPLAMHGVVNLIATVEVATYLTIAGNG